MERLANLSLAKSLAILLALPLLAVFYFVAVEVNKDLAAIETSDQYTTIPEYFIAYADVIHELQKERGKSVGLISSDYTLFGSELTVQRSKTDKSIKSLQALHADLADSTSPVVAKGADHVLEILDGISVTRRGIDARTYSQDRVVSGYSSVINGILHDIGAVTKTVESGKIAADIVAFLDVLKTEEAAGQERAALTRIYLAKAVSHSDLKTIVSLAAKQDSNNDHFIATAPDGIRELFEGAIASEGFQNALSMRQRVLNVAAGQLGSNTLNIDPVSVFDAQTRKIDELKKVEDRIGEDLRKIALKQHEHAVALLWLAVIECIAVVFVTLALAFAIVRSILKRIDTARHVAERLGQGDLTGRSNITSTDEISQLIGSLDTAKQRLVRVLGDINETASELNNGTTEIAQGNMSLSDRTQTQAASLDSINLKVGELSKAVKSSAERQAHGDRLSEQAMSLSNTCGEMVETLFHSMQEIKGASNGVKTITSVINDIAFQTNLLSLNAAVEAARAGEMGKGFAVVAAEVRQLSQRSSTAASEIGDLIDESVKKISTGGELADSVRSSLVEVQNAVTSVTEVMRELSDYSHSQANDIDGIYAMVQEIDDMTQHNTAMVEEVAAASQRLSHNSATLKTSVGYFEIDKK